MRDTLHKLDYLAEISLKENINQRRKDIGCLLLHHLLDQPLHIHIRKVEDRSGQNTLIKGEEEDRHCPLLPPLLHNQIMIMVDTKD